jgi:hypothetical protein
MIPGHESAVRGSRLGLTSVVTAPGLPTLPGAGDRPPPADPGSGRRVTVPALTGTVTTSIEVGNHSLAGPDPPATGHSP